MYRALTILLASLFFAGMLTSELWPRGGGGGGGGRGGGGGGGRSPSMSRPSRPTTAQRPSRPTTAQRPSRPSASGNYHAARPTTKPSQPSSSRPGNLAQRPATRPSRPGGVERPGVSSSRPGTGTRPGTATRPSRDQVGDFLGLPAGGRGDRDPQQIRDRYQQNLDKRPDGEQLSSRLENRPDRVHDGLENRPDRIDNLDEFRSDRHEWADDIRDNFADHHHDCFTPDWWDEHCHWHDHWHDYHPNAGYWWGAATWAAFTGWYAYDWEEPVNYDYGTTVVYEGDTVYYEGQPVGTTEEYYTQAAEIAATAPPPTEAAPANAEEEMLPLGVFAAAPEKADAEATLMIQLAINKQGQISGTLFNTLTDQAFPVQGSVDKKSQRAAWTIEGKEGVVVETGIYNLTEEETPVLVHFGSDRTETWMLARLEGPKGEGAE